MQTQKISISITKELSNVIDGLMIEKEMSRSRVVETLLRENALVRKNIALGAAEPRVFVAPRNKKIKIAQKHHLVSANK